MISRARAPALLPGGHQLFVQPSLSPDAPNLQAQTLQLMFSKWNFFVQEHLGRAVFYGGWTLAILSHALLKNNSSEAFVLCSQSVVWPLWVLAWQKKKIYYYYYFFLRFSFFLMWTIFEVFIQRVTILFLFPVLLFWLRGVWSLSSLTRDGICTPCVGRQSPKHWTTREVPGKKILNF